MRLLNHSSAAAGRQLHFLEEWHVYLVVIQRGVVVPGINRAKDGGISNVGEYLLVTADGLHQLRTGVQQVHFPLAIHKPFRPN
ncbi:hypothetical protein D3C80_1667140 [compost metagenome]